MLIPHRNLLIATSLWLGSAAIAIVLPPAQPLWQLGGALLLTLALADAWIARRTGNPLTVKRTMANIWPVGVNQTIHLHLCGSQQAIQGELYDLHPQAFAATTLPLPFRLRKQVIGSTWLITFMLTERGEHHFGHIQLRLVSPFRL